MNDATVRRLTGLAGVAIGVAATLVVPLYFIYSGPPPAWNVFTRNLLNLTLCALLIVFIVGLCHLIRRADAAYEWVAALASGAGLIYVTLTLVATSLEAGAVFGSPHGTIDPTIDGPLAEGNILIHGSIKRLVTALFLTAAGYGVLRTKVLPGWVGRAAYAVALFNLFFVPSIYFGKDPARFYSAVGWGNTAFAASFILYWAFAVGVTLLRQPRTESFDKLL